MSNIKPGTRVKWVSQAQGSRVERRGTVVTFIPAGHSALAYVPKGTPMHWIKAKNVAKVDRYLVEVRQSSDVWHYYCPRASQVEVDET